MQRIGRRDLAPALHVSWIPLCRGSWLVWPANANSTLGSLNWRLLEDFNAFYIVITGFFAFFLAFIALLPKTGCLTARARDCDLRIYQVMVEAFVDGDPANSSETTKAKKPLAAAEVTVAEVEGNPGYYTSKFYLRPHYQLEGLTVSLRLVSKLPSVKN